MSLDSSRFTFQPWTDFLGVLMQQGRVQLDSDWNEWIAELDRRIRAGTLDTIGRAVVPRETPDGFLVQLTAGDLTIGRGRIYVDGLLAENHGALPVPWDSVIAQQQRADGLPVTEWDPVLAELCAQGAVEYDRQPYYPNAPPLPESGNGLVYLDVWQREVTCLEQPDLIEKAVGVDTTGRLQTVWQVKFLAFPEGGQINCATPDDQIPGWPEATASSAGRLTTATADVAGQPDPCIIPPSGGYKGLENQLYRVEIHDGGEPKSPNSKTFASFKWSRDNASVATRVVTIPDLSHLVADSTGRDDDLRFSDGDWIEITDDWLELNNLPGEIRRIAVGGGVDDATRTITLEAPLSAGLFPVDAQNVPDPARHTRIRRWDQKGKILKDDGSSWFDLDAAGSAGVIPVPPAGTALLLENGIVVKFDLDPAGGQFKSGDDWTFAARAADASIEVLDKVPPRAIHHHYARLAVVTFPDAESDCRVLWPPEQAAGEGCECSICVTADGHNSGAGTLQEAVNAVAQTGGTICLGSGTYNLRETLQIAGPNSVRLRGQGLNTILVLAEGGTAIAIESSKYVTLENFAVLGPASEGSNGLVQIANAQSTRLRGVALSAPASTTGLHAAITLADYVVDLAVNDCVMMTDVGIANASGADAPELAEKNVVAPLSTQGLDISDNLIWCIRRGVQFAGQSLHSSVTRIAGNLFHGCSDAGLFAVGAALPGASLDVIGNALAILGSGIVIGTDGARITDNDVTFMGRVQSGDGIALAPGLDPGGIDHCQIMGNRIFGAAPDKEEDDTLDGTGQGIVIRTTVNSAMIKQNVINGVAAGIVMEEGGSAGYLSIENNQFLNVATGPLGDKTPLAAIAILAADRADFVNNFVSGFARDAAQSERCVALQAVGSSEIRIVGNRFHGVGPIGQFAGETVAVEILGSFARADVCDNVVTRAGNEADKLGEGDWQALRIGAGHDKASISGKSFTLAKGAGTAALFTLNHVYALDLLRGELTARGNHLESSNGSLALVEVDGVETCIFTDNYCTQTTSSKAPLVLLRNANVSASGNRLRGGMLPTGRPADTMQIVSGSATVTGNFTTGDILLADGQSIFDVDPWKALNVRN